MIVPSGCMIVSPRSNLLPLVVQLHLRNLEKTHLLRVLLHVFVDFIQNDLPFFFAPAIGIVWLAIRIRQNLLPKTLRLLVDGAKLIVDLLQSRLQRPILLTTLRLATHSVTLIRVALAQLKQLAHY